MAGFIDPFGIMTKHGQMKDFGAIGLYDFEMKAKLDQWLSVEEAKGFLYVKERAHIGARYHQAVFSELVPRFWCVNYGKRDDNGSVDKAEWFEHNNLPGLALLMEENTKDLMQASDHLQATARRAVIFQVNEPLYDRDTNQAASDAIAIAVFDEHMKHATPLD